MKKLQLIALSLFATTGLLTSCRGKSGVGADYKVDMTVDTRGVEIDFWTSFGADVTAALETVLNEFKEETGIKVTHTGKGGYEGLREAVSLGASGQKYPNVCIGYPDHFAGYINSDIQLRLDFLIEHDKEIPATREEDENYPNFTEVDPIDMSSFYPDYMNENLNLEFKPDGTGYTLGLPFNKSTEVMVYNKTFIEWGNTQDSNIKVPQTYEEIESVGDAIYKLINNVTRTFDAKKGLLDYDANDVATKGYVLGNDGKAYQDDAKCKAATKEDPVLDLTSINATEPFRVFSYDSQANFFISLIRNYGGEYTHLDKATRKGYIDFNNNITKDALKMVKKLSDKKILGIPATWNLQNYATNAFKKEETLFSISSSAGAHKNVDSKRYEMGVATVPVKDLNNKNVISQGTNLAILDKGSDKEIVASWKLIKYLTQKGNGTFAYGAGYFPCSTTGMNSDIYQSFLKGGSVSDNADDKAKRAAANVNANVYLSETEKWNKFVDAAFVGSSLVRTEAETIIPQVIEGKLSIDEILNNAYSNLASYVEKK